MALAQARLRRRRRWRENLEGWLFASPWVLGFLLFTVGPMLAAAGLAFTSWDMLSAPRWVGTENFERMISDEAVLTALRVTTVYAVVAVPLDIALAMALALLLNTGVRGMRFFRTAFYLPAVLSGVSVALLWRWVYNADFGLMNTLLGYVGIVGPAWLGDDRWALPALIIMAMWAVGGGMIVYLAGLQGIPTELYEAAQVDGAGFWPRLLRITLPMMTPVLFFQLVTGIIRALQLFTQAFVMTNGGPRDATLFFVIHLYRNAFQYFKMGYASALAWVLFFYILALTLLVFRGSVAWVYYEGELKGRRQ